MRRVALGRRAVGGPAGMGNAGLPVVCACSACAASSATRPTERRRCSLPLSTGQPGRIIAAIPSFLRPSRRTNDIAVSDRGNDATWISSLFWRFDRPPPAGQAHLSRHETVRESAGASLGQGGAGAQRRTTADGDRRDELGIGNR